MRFFSILYKDIRVFTRDARNFILLVLTPVLIVLFIGMIFMSTEPADIPIMVCNQDGSETSNIVVSSIETLEAFRVISINHSCEDSISRAFDESNIRAAILIPENFTRNILSGESSDIFITIDNTKPIWTHIAFYSRLIYQGTSQQITIETISSSWDVLQDISSSMDGIYHDLEERRERISEITQTFDSSLNKIRTAKENISEITQNALSISSDVEETTQDLSLNIQALDQELSSAMQNVQDMRSVSESIGTFPGFENYSADLLQSLDDIETSINSSSDLIQLTESMIEGLNENASQLSESIGSSGSVDFTEDLNVLENEIQGTLLFFDSTEREISLLMDNINSTRYYIEDIVNKNPAFISDPVKLSMRTYLQDKRYIDFMFPGVLIIILMMISILLSSVTFVRDRNSGLLKRMLMAPISLKFLITEKITLNLVLCLIQIPFILIIAVAVFGVNLEILSLLQILAISAISIFVFILLGLIIASFSKTESTAVMASLIVIIPMVFMSGMFFPVEVMPYWLTGAVSYLPIVLSIRFMEAVVIYGSGFWSLLQPLAGLMVYSAIFIAVLGFLIKKELAD
jgi:ABC-type multidrug transport system permease subunit